MDAAFDGVAVIGMSGRFPEANSPDKLWSNLIAGRECIRFFSQDDLDAAGVPTNLRDNPNYVRARGILEAAYGFDCDFFGYSPAEAATIDPQQRVFLECAWEALEDAGYAPAAMPGTVGVFASAGLPTYLLSLLAGGLPTAPEAAYQLLIGNDKDYLATRVSYKLNLSGPSLSIQTACSSSLVAIHYAAQSLLAGECDVALAGGVSITVPQVSGYMHRQGMILSVDGHCRPFDSGATGTLEGSGAGIVVLKPLRAALADGDRVRAVINGSAVNNDGAAKAGYTAPSVERQSAVIREALSVAGVDLDEVSYVEAHGTGTELGDPIEVSALNRAFGNARRRCPIGSLKANLGHLNAAAGVAGFIKTVLALENECIPPSINFRTPNPKVPFEAGPFFVADQAIAWPRSSRRRVAGVSSFGIGGTNAHVVLQDAPAETLTDARPVLAGGDSSTPRRSRPELLVLSARTPSALIRQRERLASALSRGPDLPLADLSHTLQVGRMGFRRRWFAACTSLEQARSVLREAGRTGETTDLQQVWMFPGQGVQRLGMGADLYQAFPIFRTAFDRCAECLASLLGRDLRPYIVGTRQAMTGQETALMQTALAQPAVFSFEYSLAQLLLSLGLRPAALLGHSVGEFAAACVADVLSLEDALVAVSERGRLMQAQPVGAMLAVEADPAAVAADLDPDVTVSALNGPKSFVVGGLLGAIERSRERLAARGIRSARLETSHAFHSPMMDGACAPFGEVMAALTLRPPQIPILTGVTGDWLSGESATHPGSWVEQLRRPVDFAGMVRRVAGPGTVYVELGPGRTLTELVRRFDPGTPMRAIGLQRADQSGTGVASFLDGIGELWSLGASIDWKMLRTAPAWRVPLPTYPFERRTLNLVPESGPRPTAKSGEVKLSTRRPVPSANRGRQPTERANAELEALLAEYWRKVLGLTDIGPDENFFDLGGTSLLAVDLLARLRAELGLELPSRTLFDHPTISALADQIVLQIDSMSAPGAEVLLRRLEMYGRTS